MMGDAALVPGAPAAPGGRLVPGPPGAPVGGLVSGVPMIGRGIQPWCRVLGTASHSVEAVT